MVLSSTIRGSLHSKHRMISHPMVVVDVPDADPKNTSRECSVCGHINKGNRKNQAEFHCQKCGHNENADINASKNMSSRGICQLSRRPLSC
ncbi:zinc ribbon domain-containing protein [uncultured Methanolobus sp.]|uniref:zinc ribbon domain-containing protein n=1 Tax=uncultured Methanolobus sp. TaxID=218300 RepID=UPI0029C8CC13|nr:zinc ribbon domain-containing protein [uncultured Methanolobus sp.]